MKNIFYDRLGRKGFLLPAFLFIVFPYFISFLAHDYGITWVFFVFSLPAAIPITLKRLCDIGWTKWFIVLLFIPFLNILFLLPLLLIPGKKISDTNQETLKASGWFWLKIKKIILLIVYFTAVLIYANISGFIYESVLFPDNFLPL